MKIETGNQLQGMATGGMFMAFFGGVWFFFALLERGIVNWANLTGVGAGVALLLALALYLFKISKRWPKVEENPAVRRSFMRVNAAQWLAGVALYFLLQRLHLEDYFLSGLTAIVGWHFFPLARLFRNPANYATGALLVAWSVAGILYVPLEHLPSITGFGTGLILWQSAATVLSVGVYTAHHAQLPRPAF